MLYNFKLLRGEKYQDARQFKFVVKNQKDLFQSKAQSELVSSPVRLLLNSDVNYSVM